MALHRRRQVRRTLLVFQSRGGDAPGHGPHGSEVFLRLLVLRFPAERYRRLVLHGHGPRRGQFPPPGMRESQEGGLMSVKWMGAVLDLDIETSQKFVLPVLADHADHEGSN